MGSNAEAGDAIFGQKLLLLQPGDLVALGRRQSPAPLELLHLLVEAAVFGGELGKHVLLRIECSHRSILAHPDGIGTETALTAA